MYVFVRSGSTWTQQAYLKASNTGASDQFGFSVGISGDTVVVGANLEDSNATTINGNQTNNSAASAVLRPRAIVAHEDVSGTAISTRIVGLVAIDARGVTVFQPRPDDRSIPGNRDADAELIDIKKG